MNKDKLHYNLCKVDSYNKPFNFIISSREAGKTTASWNKAYKKFDSEGKATIVIRRLINDITETYILDIETVINKFLPENKQIKFDFKKGTIKEGVVNVYVKDKLFLRVIALSNPMSRIKSTIIRNPAYIIFDEFICNMRCGEKYVKDEAFKFKEIYNTYQRECEGYVLKCYFLGNPYSLYNPYFSDLQVNTLLLKPGNFIVGKTYIVDVYKLRDSLIEKLKKNPLYQLDDSYTRYAFDGSAVNDANIRLAPKQPDGYKLKFIFRINNRYLGVFRDTRTRKYIGEDCGKYWVTIFTKNLSAKKIYAVDFDNLVDGSVLLDLETALAFQRFKISIARRDTTYASVEAAYLVEELFSCI